MGGGDGRDDRTRRQRRRPYAVAAAVETRGCGAAAVHACFSVARVCADRNGGGGCNCSRGGGRKRRLWSWRRAPSGRAHAAAATMTVHLCRGTGVRPADAGLPTPPPLQKPPPVWEYLDRRVPLAAQRARADHAARQHCFGGRRPQARRTHVRPCTSGYQKRHEHGAVGWELGRRRKGGGRGGHPGVATISGCRCPLGSDRRVGRVSRAGGRTDGRAAVPFSVAAEWVTGGGGPPRRPPADLS